MENYLIYVLIVTITVASPGPGVLLTLSNAIRYNFIATFSAILGIVLGILVIAIISVTSLGLLLATSAFAFTLMKYIGAAYLIYLGVKLWCSPIKTLETNKPIKQQALHRYFTEGFMVSLLNPKAIFFFMSLFPQFINLSTNYTLQFTYLTLTFCSVIIIVHTLYALTAQATRKWLTTPIGKKKYESSQW